MMTDEHIYKTPAEFDRALKKAAKAADGDTGERYRQGLRDSFLCRVFTDPKERFVLKGGSGMLARVPDARATRDADFAKRAGSPEAHQSFEDASLLASKVFDPALGGADGDLEWNPEALEWRQAHNSHVNS